ncbi:hypothetical protein DW228_09885 [Bacteroides fragilis]|uniref:Uncharacterized protein n=1 Tax=Bacteroides fragilis TaxID=817 RepID=A0A396C226_BACFG|nr:hypothetical protein IB64_017540 [Bacteroides fragilis]QLK85118.1 hypothetical protein DBK98_018105 [Bacteroides sp. PHL 2737]QCQ39023.1 hypothetical protein IA74_017540 [Bacteroides fragilis]QCQ47641.1 hypothetical protein EC80_017645 [Bacteroides fragilis]QCQ52224.1 hypothetical protein EE52_013640 [Bacteroides fragilis]
MFYSLFVFSVKKERAPSQVATGLFLNFCYIFNEVYTYERCSLTTVGVVTGATTNMYLLAFSSLLIVI